MYISNAGLGNCRMSVVRPHCPPSTLLQALDMRSRSPTALVLGANGRFGQAAVAAFAEAGWRVLAQVRRAPPQPATTERKNPATLLVPRLILAPAFRPSGRAWAVPESTVSAAVVSWRQAAGAVAKTGVCVGSRSFIVFPFGCCHSALRRTGQNSTRIRRG